MNDEINIPLDLLQKTFEDTANIDLQNAFECSSRGDTVGALEHLNHAIRFRPRKGILYRTRALIYFEKRKFKEAISDFSLSIKYSKDISRDYFMIAICKTELGRHNESLPYFSNAIKYFQDQPSDDGENAGSTMKYNIADIYFSRGKALNTLKMYYEARQDFLKAAEINPVFRTTYQKLYSFIEKPQYKQKPVTKSGLFDLF